MDSKTVVVIVVVVFALFFFSANAFLGVSPRLFDRHLEFLTTAKIQAVLQSIAKTIVF